MPVIYNTNPRVFINGVDISEHVRDITVRCAVGDLTRTTLELVTSPQIHGNVIYFGENPLPEAQTSVERGIRLRENG